MNASVRVLLAGVVLAISFPGASAAVADDGRALPAGGLKADAVILRTAYEGLHPGLYRYQTRAQMDAAFAELDRQFSRDLTLQQAYVDLALFLAKIQCGHTYANFFNQSEAVSKALFQHQDRLPFYFRWIDRRMIVTKSLSEDPGIRPGAEVLAINGTPANVVLARLMTVARADGANDAKRVNSLQVVGDSKYEAFDVYYPMFFPLHDPQFHLRVRDPATGAVSNPTVPAQTYEQRLEARKEAAATMHGGSEQLFRFAMDDDGTGVLRMPTWATYDSKWDWQSFVNGVFEQLDKRKSGSLVIDLRDNEGGSDVGNLILRHLIDRDLHLSRYRRLVRYRKTPDSLAPYLDTWDPSFKDWAGAALPFDDRYFRLTKYDDDPNGDVLKPAGPRFTGKVYVLVDASNSSATFQFDQIVQQSRLGTLVGETTGGNQRGINGGAFFFLRLPNSHLEADLPLIATFPDGELPNAGIAPDVSVRPSVLDIANGVDTVMNVVRSIIRSSVSSTRLSR